MIKNENNNRRVYIRPEDALEFVYEISDKWKNINDMKEDLRVMIRYFKEEKYNKLKEEFNLDL